MSYVLTKLAKEQDGGDYSWVIPATLSTLPPVAYGASRHGELALRESMADSKKEALLQKALKSRNIKTTLAMAGLAAGATAGAELARRSFATKEKDKQTKEIQKAVKQVVKQAEVIVTPDFSPKVIPQQPSHDYRPAAISAAMTLPLDLAIGASATGLNKRMVASNWGKKLMTSRIGSKVFKHGFHTPLIGVLGAGTAFAEVDYFQRRAEKNKYLNKVAREVGRHNDKPDSAFPKKELAMGRKVELEHTDDQQVAENIAKDHLSESGKYYSALKKMEDNLKKQADEYADIAKIHSAANKRKADVPVAVGTAAAGAIEGGGLTWLAGRGLDVATKGKTQLANKYLTAVGAVVGAGRATKSHLAELKKEDKEKTDLKAAILRQAVREGKRAG